MFDTFVLITACITYWDGYCIIVLMYVQNVHSVHKTVKTVHMYSYSIKWRKWYDVLFLNYCLLYVDNTVHLINNCTVPNCTQEQYIRFIYTFRTYCTYHNTVRHDNTRNICSYYTYCTYCTYYTVSVDSVQNWTLQYTAVLYQTVHNLLLYIYMHIW